MKQYLFSEKIDGYLKKVDTDYALLINGVWGSGKTFLMEQYIKSRSEYKFVKIDLYGVHDMDSLYSHFVFNYLDLLQKRKTGFSSVKLMLGFLSVIQKTWKFKNIPIDKFIEKISSSIFNDKRVVLVFDNTERSSLDIVKIMGFINSLVEMKVVKVIIIADEKKLVNKDNYKEIKERTIGKKVIVNNVTNDALIEIIKSKKLETYSNLIFESYLSLPYGNLRVSIRVLDQLYFIIDEMKSDELYLQILEDFIPMFFGFGVIYNMKELDVEEFTSLTTKYIEENNKTLWLKRDPEIWYEYFYSEDYHLLNEKIIGPGIERVKSENIAIAREKEKQDTLYWKNIYDLYSYDDDESFYDDLKKVALDLKELDLKNINDKNKLYSLFCKIDILMTYNDKIENYDAVISALDKAISSDKQIDDLPKLSIDISVRSRYSKLGPVYENYDNEDFINRFDLILNRFIANRLYEKDDPYSDFLEIIKEGDKEKLHKKIIANMDFPSVNGMDANLFYEALVKNNPSLMLEIMKVFLSKYSDNSFINNEKSYVYHVADLNYLLSLLSCFKNGYYSYDFGFIKLKAINDIIKLLENTTNRMGTIN